MLPRCRELTNVVFNPNYCEHYYYLSYRTCCDNRYWSIFWKLDAADREFM